MIIGIMGQPRSGTSAVAGLLALSGLKWWGNRATLDDMKFRSSVAEFIPDRLEERGTGGWFFKFPGLWKQRTEFEDHLPDLRYIMVVRDPVAVAMHATPLTPNLKDKVKHKLEYYSDMFETDKPQLFVSYEKLMLEPDETLDAIEEYIGRSIPRNKAKEWLKPGYKEIAKLQ